MNYLLNSGDGKWMWNVHRREGSIESFSVAQAVLNIVGSQFILLSTPCSGFDRENSNFGGKDGTLGVCYFAP